MPAKKPAERFRAIALAHEGAVEGAHMGHPDFRVGNKVFASIHTNDQFGMVKLTPDQQQMLIQDHSEAYAPESGAWGRAGCTRVILKELDEESLGEAMTMAWRNVREASKKKPRPRR